MAIPMMNTPNSPWYDPSVPIGTPLNPGTGKPEQGPTNNLAMVQDMYQLPFEPTYSKPDPNQYNIGGKTRAGLANVGDPDMSGLQAYKNEALRTGPSKGSMLAMDRIRMDDIAGRDRAAKSAAGEAANARSNLAMRGGIGSGARERVARDAIRGGLASSQDVSRTTANNNSQTMMNDEGNRLNMLSGLGEQQNSYMKIPLEKARIQATADQTDASNYMKTNSEQNAWNRDMWGQKMQGWAANRTANATENSGK